MSEREPYDCVECGTEIEDKDYSRYTPKEKAVCIDCWFDELDGQDRKFWSERANRLREQRIK